MDISRADSHHPELRPGKGSEQPIPCLHLVFIDLVTAALDVDGNKLALVGGFELRTDVLLLNGVTTPGDLFVAVSRFDRSHNLFPFSGIWYELPSPLSRIVGLAEGETKEVGVD
jgi:hypothetical protein